jgi:serine/threonine-protein kinase
MIGKTVLHYKITEELGRGGMGVVYKAEDTKLGRDVALKFISSKAVDVTVEKSRFMHEARAAASLSHPNICTIHEINDFEGNPFIAMEFIEGRNLKSAIEAGPLGLDDAVNIAVQVAEGLTAAHEKGVVHRDIKSANIMITEKGKVKIMDFGLAKSTGRTQLTREGTTLGTVAYMSPEQAQAYAVDHRSDIWSLGVVLYEMIAGTQPFRGEYEQAVVYSIINTDPEPLTALRTGIPMELERIVMRCLAKDPAERYQTAEDLVADLRRYKRIESARDRKERPPGANMRHAGAGRPGKRQGLRLLLFFLPVLAAIIAVLSYRYFPSDEKRAIPGRKMLAVLPFENLGPSDEEYFADGITEELIARLATIEKLGVIARTSVMRYKETEKSINDIGEELGVDYILEGTIRWQRISDTESRVRITPQLVKVSDETHLWAEVYQRDMTDIFAVQSEIAGQVAKALDITLLEKGEKGKRFAVPTDKPEAYRVYLEGRFWWNKRSQEGFDRAIELFDEAIRIDPGYALAYAGKAECYCMLAIHLARPAKFVEIAREAAGKAVELDDSLPEAHNALGWIAFVYDYDYIAAERYFQRAIDLNPDYATTYNWYGVMLACIGRGDEAVEIMMRARQLDPGSMIINRDLGCVLSWVGRLDDAMEQLRKTIAMDPDFLPARAHLGRIFTAKGMYEEAIAEFEKIQSIDSEYFNLDMMLAYTYARTGRMEECTRILENMLALSDTQKGKAFEIATVYVGLGDNDKAFEWFEKAVENREFAVVLLDVHIWLDDLRGDPRFEVLRGKIGFIK